MDTDQKTEVQSPTATFPPKAASGEAVEEASPVAVDSAQEAVAPTLKRAGSGLEDAEHDAKRTVLAVRRKRLETRYLGATFIDADAAADGVRTIERIDYDSEDAVWIAVTTPGAVPYYLNAASDMDAMIEAHRAAARQNATAAAADAGADPAWPPATGSNIEVLWSVADDATDEARDVWWRATVEGASEKRHAIAGDAAGDAAVEIGCARLLYDARPELSEPEAARSSVGIDRRSTAGLGYLRTPLPRSNRTRFP